MGKVSYNIFQNRFEPFPNIYLCRKINLNVFIFLTVAPVEIYDKITHKLLKQSKIYYDNF